MGQTFFKNRAKKRPKPAKKELKRTKKGQNYGHLTPDGVCDGWFIFSHLLPKCLQCVQVSGQVWAWQYIRQGVVEPLGRLGVPQDPAQDLPEPPGRLVHDQPQLDGLVATAADGQPGQPVRVQRVDHLDKQRVLTGQPSVPTINEIIRSVFLIKNE